MPKLSVIVPVYNVEKYLSRCVDSILAQTFQDFELILVDDGSPDKCPEICDKLSKKDKRIIVLHKTNGGLSDARNAGMNIMKGDYVSFIDSDDFIHPNMFLSMISQMEKEEADISVCSYTKTSSDVISPNESDSFEVFDKIDSVKNLYNPDYGFSFITAWGKIYKSSLFENILFPKGKYHEDEFTTYKLLYKANKVVYLHSKYYFYYFNPTSIINSSFSVKNLDSLEAFKERIDFFEGQNEISLSKLAQNALMTRIMYCYQRICEEKKLADKKILKKKTLNFLHFADKKSYIKSLSLKNKVWAYLFFVSADLYSFIRNKLKIGL